MEQAYLPNFSYLFVPFTTEDFGKFTAFCDNITPQNGWLATQIDNRYLHRYVVERIENPNRTADCQFRIDHGFAEKQGLFLGTKQYRTAPKIFGGEKNSGFIFQIAGVDLRIFRTGICILAFELRFAENDPFKISQ